MDRLQFVPIKLRIEIVLYPALVFGLAFARSIPKRTTAATSTVVF